MGNSTLDPLFQRWPDERLAIVTKGGPVSIFEPLKRRQDVRTNSFNELKRVMQCRCLGYAPMNEQIPTPSWDAGPRTIDDYLATLTNDKRAALEELREIIRGAIPAAEECVTYGLAAFLFNGRTLVGFGATDSHCAFYPMSSNTVQRLKEDLKNYDTSKGTVRFQPDKPLPGDLVHRLIKDRLAENGMPHEAFGTTSKNLNSALA